MNKQKSNSQFSILNSQLGKRLLSIALALVLILGMAPVMTWNTASALAADLPSAQANKTAVLQDLGFNMDQPAYPSSTPYGSSRVTINPFHELFLSYSNQSTLSRLVYDVKKDLVNGVYVDSLVQTKYRVTGASSASTNVYNRVASGDFLGTGKAEYVAQVYLTGLDNGLLSLRVYEALTGVEKTYIRLHGNSQTANNPMNFTGSTNKRLDPWEVGAFLSVTAGDFDGDGRDEIAVYVPGRIDNAVNTIYIYKFDGSSLNYQVQVDLPNEFNNTTISNNKRNFLAVALEAADLNGDGRDDLVVTAGYHKDSNIVAVNNNASSLLVFQAKSNIYQGMDLIRNTRLTLSYNGTNYNLRNASATIGDVNGDGIAEIIVAGNVSLQGSWNLRTHNGPNSDGRPWHAIACYNGAGAVINDFKMFEDDYNSYDMVYAYTTDTNDSPVALTAFKASGGNYPESIFLDGLIYSYNTSSGFMLNSSARDEVITDAYPGGSGKTNTWFAEAVAGNFTNDPDGKETVAFVQVLKQSGKEQYDYHVSTLIKDQIDTGDNAWTAKMTKVADNEKGYLSIAPVNIDNDSIMIRYTNKRDYYFTDPKIIAVMQAAPYFSELEALDAGYPSAGTTTFGQSTGSGGSHSESVSVTAGLVVGFEQGASVFGLFKTGIDFETKLTGSMGYEYQHAYEKTYTVTYNSPSDTDRVALTMIPYVRYYYEIFVPTFKVLTLPEYNALKSEIATLETWLLGHDTSNSDYVSKYREYIAKEQARSSVDAALDKGYGYGSTVQAYWDSYVVSSPGEVRTVLMTVDKYDSVASQYSGMDTIRGNALLSTYQAGDPASYRVSTAGLSGVDEWENPGGGGTNWSSVSTGGGSIAQTIDLSSSDSNGITWGADLEVTIKVSVGGGKAGPVMGVSYEGGYAWVSTSGSSYSGEVGNMPDGADDYGFDWRFIYHTATLNGNSAYVLEYLTKNINAPPSAPARLRVHDYDSSSVTLAWDVGARPAQSYVVYRYVPTALNPYIPIGMVDGTTTEFMDVNCNPDTSYSYVVQAVSGSRQSVYTNPVTARTTTAIGIPKAEISGPAEVRAGRAATLNVTVTQSVMGAVSTSYAWQRRTVGSGTWTIVGTSTVYTIASVTQTMHGDQYRCVVTQMSGGETPQGVSNIYTLVVGRGESVTTLSLSDLTGVADHTYDDVAYEDVDRQTPVTAEFGGNSYAVYANITGFDSEGDYIYGDMYYLRRLFEDTGGFGYYEGYGLYPVQTPADSVLITAAALEDTTPQSTAPDAPVTLSVMPNADESPVGGNYFAWYIQNGVILNGGDLSDYLLEDYTLNPLVLPTFTPGPLGSMECSGYGVFTTIGTDDYYIVEFEDDVYGFYYDTGSGYEQLDAETVYLWRGFEDPLYDEDVGHPRYFSSPEVQPLMKSWVEEVINTSVTKIDGDEVSLTANVAEDTSVSPLNATGTVRFEIINLSDTSNKQYIDATLNGSGIATAGWTPPAEGVYQIIAYYGGDGNLLPSNSLGETYIAYVSVGATKALLLQAPESIVYGETLAGRAAVSLYSDGNAANISSGYTMRITDSQGEDAASDFNTLLIPGVYTVTVSYTDVGVDYTAKHKLSVTKKPISVAATNRELARNIDVIAEYSREANAAEIELRGGSTLVSGDALTPSYFWLTCDLLDIANTYPINITYNTDYSPPAALMNFQSKYDVTFIRGTLTVTEESHAVTYSAGDNGKISATYGDNNYQFASGKLISADQSLSFTVTPDEGFAVENWNVNGSPILGKTDLTYTLSSLAADLDVKVTFARARFSVTYGVDGGNGSLDASVGAAPIVSGTPLTSGIDVNFTANPDAGYVVDSWWVNGVAKAGAYGLTLSVENLAQNTEVKVKFRPEEAFTVTVNTSGSGSGVVTLTSAGGTVANGGSVPYGSDLTATITLSPLSLVNGWKVNGVTVAGANVLSVDITGITENIMIEVVLDSILPPTVTNVTVSPPTANVQQGTTQQFVATVTGTNSPAQTVSWSLSGGTGTTNISASGLLTVDAAQATATSLTITATSTVDTSKSGDAIVTVTDTPTTYTVTLSGGGTGASGSGSYTTGAVVSIDAGNRSNYTFSGWTASPAVAFADESSASTTFNMPANNVTVTANWNTSGGGGGGGGGGGPGPVTTPPDQPDDEDKTSNTDNRYTIDTHEGSEPVENNDGSITIPDGGTIITKDGTKIETPPGTIIEKDGKIKFPEGGGGTITDSHGNTFNVREDATIILDLDTPLGYYISIVNPFEDVFERDWFFENVMFVYARGLMIGTSTHPMLFSPNATTTRGMIVTVLYRMAGSPINDERLTINDERFTDVDEGMWYSDSVKWAAANGIISGYGDGRFGPNDAITRQDLAVILMRYAEYMGIQLSPNSSFLIPDFSDDADIANYAKDAVERLYNAGIIGGYPDGSFKPKGIATRAEVATILHRFIEAV